MRHQGLIPGQKINKPFPGPLWTHGLYKFYCTGKGGSLAWYACTDANCSAKASVSCEEIEDDDGNTVYHYTLVRVATHEVRIDSQDMIICNTNAPQIV